MFKNRKIIYASLLLTIALLIGGWFIVYEYCVRTLEKTLVHIEAQLTKKGYQVSYSKASIAGTPFLLGVKIENLQMIDPNQRLKWEGPEIRIQVQPWRINTLICQFEGEHKISLPTTIPLPLGILVFEGAEGNFTFDLRGRLNDADVTVDKISSVLDKESQPVYIGPLSLKVNNIENPLKLSFILKTEVKNIEKVLGLQPFDHPLKLYFEGKLSGYEPQTLPTTFAIWRDGGGIIDIDQLKIDWPPLLIEADGSLTIDKEMYPLGSFSSKIVGYQDALQDMVQLGWIKKKRAKTASFMLELFSTPDETYGRKLTIPITLQNKQLLVGPAPLLKLRPLENF